MAIQGQAAALSSVNQTTVSMSLEGTQQEVLVVPLDAAGEFINAVNGVAVDQHLLSRIEALRKEQIDIEDRHFVPGRNAILGLVGKAYAVYFDAVESPPEQQAAITQKLTKLMKAKDDGYKERVNATLVGLFLQYVFCKLDAKQKHIYGVAMSFAHARGTQPADFETFIKANGGFEKVRAACAKKKAGTPEAQQAVDALDAALMMLQAKEAIETLAPDQLELYEDEKVIVLFGVRQDDGSVAIVNAELTDDEADDVVRLYAASMKQLVATDGKGKRRRLTEAERKQKAKLKGDIAYREQLIAEYDFDLKKAKAAGHLEEVDKLRAMLMVEQAILKALKAARKDVNKQLAGEV